MSAMFANCYALKNVDVSSFDTSSVGDMNSIFYNCSSLQTIPTDLFKYNINVTTFNQTFINCSLVNSKFLTI